MSNAKTIVYVHGIGNKPLPEILKCQWDHALMGYDLGERSRLAYWVNREFYPEPENATCKDTDGVGKADPVDISMAANGEGGITPLAVGLSPTKQAAKLVDLGEKMLAAAERNEERYEPEEIAGALRAKGVQAKVLPLPAPIRRWITRQVVKRFLRDVNDYFYVPARRQVMCESLQSRLDAGGGPFVVIAHSQGSMIAYDVLSRMPAGSIDLLVTIGSPLGITEVQDQLKRLLGTKKLTVPAAVKRWVNVADPLDPVCLDKGLANDYGAAIEDHLLFNPESPHSGTGYLKLPPVREAVSGTVDSTLFQRVAEFTIARDLVRVMENAPGEARHEVLIELTDEAGPPRDLTGLREQVAGWIRQQSRLSDEELGLERLQRFVAARLTRSEAELLANLGDSNGGFHVARLWRNQSKRAFIDKSVHTVQARPAHLGYDARGKDIHWAVLDTGIAAEHPHFDGVIDKLYDCTRPGPLDAPTKDKKKKGKRAADGNGHGTHVAGIIAGHSKVTDCEAIAMAPEARLHIYKVLDDQGNGSDATIIKALDHIASVNEGSSKPVIHGVNLSLGGGYDPSVFGCGYTPLCRELRRLWQQGVIVVLAAGNEGYARLMSEEGLVEANLDLSIGDPANLEEAIAVGSTHREMPHRYGISFFSSRGPTADGRMKPDLVAPGERIWSCRHDFPAKKTNPSRADLYVRMSGTSMAAPHVSGLLAAFLSARRQFIGRPDEVKSILLEQCIDLKRERSHQGAGLPNLVKMLLNT